MASPSTRAPAVLALLALALAIAFLLWQPAEPAVPVEGLQVPSAHDSATAVAVTAPLSAEQHRVDATPAVPAVPRGARSVCLLGRFSAPSSRPEVIKQLRAAGFDVRTAVTDDVQVLLVGHDALSDDGSQFEPVERTAAYRAAIKKGAAIVRTRDLASLLQ